METKKQQTAVEYLHSEYKRILGSVLVTPQQIIEMSDALENAKEIDKERKIYMLHSIIHDAQMGEDVEDVEAWFKKYEKQQKTE